MFKLVFPIFASEPKDYNLYDFTNVLPSPAKAWLLMICWSRACRLITKLKPHLFPTWIQHVLLLVVPIGELNCILLTLDILVHLKQLSITGLFHTGLTGKETSHRVRAAICVDLSSEVTLPHKMAAQRNVRKKKQLAAEGWPQSLEKAGM